ncbi:hypothetical protein ACFQV2_25500 [Actinokineospora soli]|uniref:Uncharacterized protein n=1 Tax=Actinokineospora soli TaxID=1048753 RepID=A0ABW2TSZ5_9PSEU
MTSTFGLSQVVSAASALRVGAEGAAGFDEAARVVTDCLRAEFVDEQGETLLESVEFFHTSDGRLAGKPVENGLLAALAADGRLPRTRRPGSSTTASPSWSAKRCSRSPAPSPTTTPSPSS